AGQPAADPREVVAYGATLRAGCGENARRQELDDVVRSRAAVVRALPFVGAGISRHENRVAFARTVWQVRRGQPQALGERSVGFDARQGVAADRGPPQAEAHLVTQHQLGASALRREY